MPRPVTFKRNYKRHAVLLVDYLSEKRSQVLKTAKYLIADRGYDDRKLITTLWDDYLIKAFIDIRNTWRDGEKTRPLKDLDQIVYDYQGTVCCCCPRELRLKKMAYGGFE